MPHAATCAHPVAASLTPPWLASPHVAATKRTLTARLSAAALPAAAMPPAPALTACRMLLRDAHRLPRKAQE